MSYLIFRKIKEASAIIYENVRISYLEINVCNLNILTHFQKLLIRSHLHSAM